MRFGRLRATLKFGLQAPGGILHLGPMQWQILQIWPFSALPNPQTTRVGHFDVHSKSFSSIPHLTTFCSYGLVVDSIVYGKDNMDEKTKEVAYIRMYHFGWNFFKHVGRDRQQ